jgi:hypothetical protein
MKIIYIVMMMKNWLGDIFQYNWNLNYIQVLSK